MIAFSDGGWPTPRLWCVEVVPKRKPISRNDQRKLLEMAKGIPRDPAEAVTWMVRVMGGFNDQRTATFVRDRQRLVVFRVKLMAAARAKKETNEYWSGKVRAVRVV